MTTADTTGLQANILAGGREAFFSGGFAAAGHIATEAATEAFGHAITNLGSVLNSGGLVFAINLTQKVAGSLFKAFDEQFNLSKHNPIPENARPFAATVIDLATLAGLCSGAVFVAPMLGIAAPVNLAGLFALAITSRALAEAFGNPFSGILKQQNPNKGKDKKPEELKQPTS